jgi:hypothetical protein
MAMLDAVEPSGHLRSGCLSGLTSAIAAFEPSMRGRMARLIRGSLETQDLSLRRMLQQRGKARQETLELHSFGPRF